MPTTPPMLRSLAVASIVLVTSCCKRKEESYTRGPDGEPFLPGAQHEEPAVKEVDYNDLDYESDGSFSLGGAPFTGVAVMRHDNGELKARYAMVEGRFDGLAEEWYENGVRSTYKMYKGGLRHGITTYWDEAGTPTKQVLYQEDEEMEVIDDPEELKKAPIGSGEGLR